MHPLGLSLSLSITFRTIQAAHRAPDTFGTRRTDPAGCATTVVWGGALSAVCLCPCCRPVPVTLPPSPFETGPFAFLSS
eukprot:scaffold8224_cov118-Isochrysis_galbana.AAC.16